MGQGTRAHKTAGNEIEPRLGKDSLVPLMQHNPSDLGSLIIVPDLNAPNVLSINNIPMQYRQGCLSALLLLCMFWFQIIKF